MRSQEELKALLTINRHQLDDELIQQSQVFYEVSERVAHFTSERDAYKDDLATVDAALGLQFRENARVQQVKITEALVQEYILTAETHVTAVKSLLAARQQVDEAQALREAFLQRSFMLRDLVSLQVSGYTMSNAVESATNSDFGKHEYAKRRAKLADARKVEG